MDLHSAHKTFHYSHLGEERSKMLNLNRRLEAYLNRVKVLEEENGLLSKEIKVLRCGNQAAVTRKKVLEEELRQVRLEMDAAWRDRADTVLEASRLIEELQALDLQRQREVQAQMKVEKKLEQSRNELEEEQRAQIWLREKVSQLEHEVKHRIQIHQEDVTHLETTLIHSRAIMQPTMVQRDNEKATLFQLGEEYSQRATRAWQEAAEAYQGHLASLEESLQQVRIHMTQASQDKDESQLKLQCLRQEISSALDIKLHLENTVAQQGQKYIQGIQQLQERLAGLEAEKKELGQQIDHLLWKNRGLIQVKMSLGLEVAAYRALLDSGTPRGDTTLINQPRNIAITDAVFSSQGVKKHYQTQLLASRKNASLSSVRGNTAQTSTVLPASPACCRKPITHSETPKISLKHAYMSTQSEARETPYPKVFQDRAVENFRSQEVHNRFTNAEPLLHTNEDEVLTEIKSDDQEGTQDIKNVGEPPEAVEPVVSSHVESGLSTEPTVNGEVNQHQPTTTNLTPPHVEREGESCGFLDEFDKDLNTEIFAAEKDIQELCTQIDILVEKEAQCTENVQAKPSHSETEAVIEPIFESRTRSPLSECEPEDSMYNKVTDVSRDESVLKEDVVELRQEKSCSPVGTYEMGVEDKLYPDGEEINTQDSVMERKVDLNTYDETDKDEESHQHSEPGGSLSTREQQYEKKEISQAFAMDTQQVETVTSSVIDKEVEDTELHAVLHLHGNESDDEEENSQHMSLSYRTELEGDSYAQDDTIADTSPLIRYKSNETDVDTWASHMDESESCEADMGKKVGEMGAGSDDKLDKFGTMEDLCEEIEGEALDEEYDLECTRIEHTNNGSSKSEPDAVAEVKEIAEEIISETSEGHSDEETKQLAKPMGPVHADYNEELQTDTLVEQELQKLDTECSSADFAQQQFRESDKMLHLQEKSKDEMAREEEENLPCIESEERSNQEFSIEITDQPYDNLHFNDPALTDADVQYEVQGAQEIEDKKDERNLSMMTQAAVTEIPPHLSDFIIRPYTEEINQSEEPKGVLSSDCPNLEDMAVPMEVKDVVSNVSQEHLIEDVADCPEDLKTVELEVLEDPSGEISVQNEDYDKSDQVPESEPSHSETEAVIEPIFESRTRSPLSECEPEDSKNNKVIDASRDESVVKEDVVELREEKSCSPVETYEMGVEDKLYPDGEEINTQDSVMDRKVDPKTYDETDKDEVKNQHPEPGGNLSTTEQQYEKKEISQAFAMDTQQVNIVIDKEVEDTELHAVLHLHGNESNDEEEDSLNMSLSYRTELEGDSYAQDDTIADMHPLIQYKSNETDIDTWASHMDVNESCEADMGKKVGEMGAGSDDKLDKFGTMEDLCEEIEGEALDEEYYQEYIQIEHRNIDNSKSEPDAVAEENETAEEIISETSEGHSDEETKQLAKPMGPVNTDYHEELKTDTLDEQELQNLDTECSSADFAQQPFRESDKMLHLKEKSSDEMAREEEENLPCIEPEERSNQEFSIEITDQPYDNLHFNDPALTDADVQYEVQGAQEIEDKDDEHNLSMVTQAAVTEIPPHLSDFIIRPYTEEINQSEETKGALSSDCPNLENMTVPKEVKDVVSYVTQEHLLEGVAECQEVLKTAELEVLEDQSGEISVQNEDYDKSDQVPESEPSHSETEAVIEPIFESRTRSPLSECEPEDSMYNKVTDDSRDESGVKEDVVELRQEKSCSPVGTYEMGVEDKLYSDGEEINTQDSVMDRKVDLKTYDETDMDEVKNQHSEPGGNLLTTEQQYEKKEISQAFAMDTEQVDIVASSVIDQHVKDTELHAVLHLHGNESDEEEEDSLNMSLSYRTDLEGDSYAQDDTIADTNPLIQYKSNETDADTWASHMDESESCEADMGKKIGEMGAGSDDKLEKFGTMEDLCEENEGEALDEEYDLECTQIEHTNNGNSKSEPDAVAEENETAEEIISGASEGHSDEETKQLAKPMGPVHADYNEELQTDTLVEQELQNLDTECSSADFAHEQFRDSDKMLHLQEKSSDEMTREGEENLPCVEPEGRSNQEFSIEITDQPYDNLHFNDPALTDADVQCEVQGAQEIEDKDDEHNLSMVTQAAVTEIPPHLTDFIIRPYMEEINQSEEPKGALSSDCPNLEDMAVPMEVKDVVSNVTQEHLIEYVAECQEVLKTTELEVLEDPSGEISVQNEDYDKSDQVPESEPSHSETEAVIEPIVESRTRSPLSECEPEDSKNNKVIDVSRDESVVKEDVVELRQEKSCSPVGTYEMGVEDKLYPDGEEINTQDSVMERKVDLNTYDETDKDEESHQHSEPGGSLSTREQQYEKKEISQAFAMDTQQVDIVASSVIDQHVKDTELHAVLRLHGNQSDDEEEDSLNMSLSYWTELEGDSYAQDDTIADTSPLIRYKSNETDIDTWASHMDESESCEADMGKKFGEMGAGSDDKLEKFGTMEDLCEEIEGEALDEEYDLECTRIEHTNNGNSKSEPDAVAEENETAEEIISETSEGHSDEETKQLAKPKGLVHVDYNEELQTDTPVEQELQNLDTKRSTADFAHEQFRESDKMLHLQEKSTDEMAGEEEENLPCIEPEERSNQEFSIEITDQPYDNLHFNDPALTDADDQYEIQGAQEIEDKDDEHNLSMVTQAAVTEIPPHLSDFIIRPYMEEINQSEEPKGVLSSDCPNLENMTVPIEVKDVVSNVTQEHLIEYVAECQEVLKTAELEVLEDPSGEISVQNEDYDKSDQVPESEPSHSETEAVIEPIFESRTRSPLSECESEDSMYNKVTDDSRDESGVKEDVVELRQEKSCSPVETYEMGVEDKLYPDGEEINTQNSVMERNVDLKTYDETDKDEVKDQHPEAGGNLSTTEQQYEKKEISQAFAMDTQQVETVASSVIDKEVEDTELHAVLHLHGNESNDEEEDSLNMSLSYRTELEGDSYAQDDTIADMSPLIRYKSNETDIDTWASHMDESESCEADMGKKVGEMGAWSDDKLEKFGTMEDLCEEIEGEALDEEYDLECTQIEHTNNGSSKSEPDAVAEVKEIAEEIISETSEGHSDEETKQLAKPMGPVHVDYNEELKTDTPVEQELQNLDTKRSSADFAQQPFRESDKMLHLKEKSSDEMAREEEENLPCIEPEERSNQEFSIEITDQPYDNLHFNDPALTDADVQYEVQGAQEIEDKDDEHNLSMVTEIPPHLSDFIIRPYMEEINQSEEPKGALSSDCPNLENMAVPIEVKDVVSNVPQEHLIEDVAECQEVLKTTELEVLEDPSGEISVQNEDYDKSDQVPESEPSHSETEAVIEPIFESRTRSPLSECEPEDSKNNKVTDVSRDESVVKEDVVELRQEKSCSPVGTYEMGVEDKLYPDGEEINTQDSVMERKVDLKTYDETDKDEVKYQHSVSSGNLSTREQQYEKKEISQALAMDKQQVNTVASSVMDKHVEDTELTQVTQIIVQNQDFDESDQVPESAESSLKDNGVVMAHKE